MSDYIQLDIETNLISKDDKPVILIVTTFKEDLKDVSENDLIHVGHLGLQIATENNYFEENLLIDSLICTYDLVDNKILLLYGLITDASSRKLNNTRRVQ